MARKGYYEEIKIKEYLGEITPKMFAFVKEVLDGDDKREKSALVQKILPKIIDKVLPSQIEGDLNGEFTLTWKSSSNTSQENGQSNSTTPTNDGM